MDRCAPEANEPVTKSTDVRVTRIRATLETRRVPVMPEVRYKPTTALRSGAKQTVQLPQSGYYEVTERVWTRDGQVSKKVDRRAFAGLEYLPPGTVVDGELLGDEYWLFDILELAGEDVRERGYLERWKLLDEELEPALSGSCAVLPTAVGKKTKKKLHDYLRLPSLQAYLLVAQDRRAIEIYRRAGDLWSFDIVTDDRADQPLDLPCLDAPMTLAEVYHGIRFELQEPVSN